MKQLSLITSLMLGLLVISCGTVDKKKELEKKKAELAGIQAEIKQLETELGSADSSGLKFKDVGVTVIQPTGFKHFIEIQGMVDADENVNVIPLQPGKVTRILVKEGDMVSAGQLLAEIDHDVLNKQLNSLQPQLDLAKDVYERQSRLWNQKIGSELQYLQAKTQKESIEKQIETLKEQIDMSLIKSPIAGTVDYVGLKFGQLALNMPNAPAFRIVNMSKLKVQGEVAESNLSKVRKGNPVNLYFPDLNSEINSNITFVESVIDPLTRTFTAEAALNGSNGAYHPNQIALLRIADYDNPAAITMPVNAIQSNGTESFVFIISNENGQKIARKKVVTYTNTYNGIAEISSGINPGDQVITIGQFDLVDGSLVRYKD